MTPDIVFGNHRDPKHKIEWFDLEEDSDFWSLKADSITVNGRTIIEGPEVAFDTDTFTMNVPRATYEAWQKETEERAIARGDSCKYNEDGWACSNAFVTDDLMEWTFGITI